MSSQQYVSHPFAAAPADPAGAQVAARAGDVPRAQAAKAIKAHNDHSCDPKAVIKQGLGRDIFSQKVNQQS